MENRGNGYPQAGHPRQQPPPQGKRPNTTNNNQFRTEGSRIMNHNQTKNTNKSFQVLYTHQKTKKKKTWKDGKLLLQHNNTRGSLFDAAGNVGLASGPTTLDTLELSYSQALAVSNGTLNELESEKYLIMVEGPWNDTNNATVTTITSNNNVVSNTKNNHFRNKPGMQKLLTTKFRVPSKIIPLHPEERQKRLHQQQQQLQQNGGLGNKRRRRPLQPGELERQYYGDSCNGGARYYGERSQSSGWNGGVDGGSRGGYDDGRGGNYSMQSNGFSNNNLSVRREGNERSNNNEYNEQLHRNNDNNQERNFGQPYQNNHDVSSNVQSRSLQYANNNHDSGQRPTQYNNNHAMNQPARNPRVDFRKNHDSQHASNQGGGDNNRGGVGAKSSFRSNNNRGRFRSSGYDPTGFYAEEDDEDDGEQQNDSSFEDCRVGNDDGSTRAGLSGRLDGNRGLERDNHRDYARQNDPEPNMYHESTSLGINKEEQTNQEQSRHNDMTNPSSKDDHDEQVTNHLLALLGAAPPSASNEAAPPLMNSDHPDPKVQEQRDSNYDDSKDNGDNNSFLASIRQMGADEDQQQQGDGPVGYDWTADSDFDDDDEEEDDPYAQGDICGNNESSFLNDIVGIGSKPPPNESATAIPKESITGFTLPSAGESSSDDSDDE